MEPDQTSTLTTPTTTTTGGTLDPAARAARTPRGSGFWVVGAVLVLLMLSSSVPSALYVLYQEKWGLSSGTITVVFALYAVTVLAGLLLFGSLSDTLGRRPVLGAGLVLAIVSMGLFAGAQGLGLLLAARAVQGLAVGLATGAMGAALLELTPRSRPALGAQVNSAGPTIGIGLGGIGAGLLVQYAPAPTVLSYLLLIGAFAVTLVGVARMGESAPGAGGGFRVVPHRIRIPAASRGRFAVLVLTIVAVWSVGGFYLSLGPHLVLSLLQSTNYLVGGATVALLAGAATVAQLLLGGTEALRTAVIGLLGLLAGLGLVLLALGTGSAALFLVATAVLGSGWGAAFLGSFRALSALADPAHRGELTAAVYVFAYLAMSVPAVLAGMLTNIHGLHRTSVGFMAAVAAVCALALLVTLRLAARTRAEGRTA
ncbi:MULTISPECIES: MFS transporter [unclassified Streptomyces]|uniref:MFS transporter n=1 Tax=unclassified Streptomyces TaxID=2593676 RepID=UPI00224F5925|nr:MULTISPECIES: MFS transporter [unclassified Streptomyces]MCX4524782.1 MFS transporter [Streptomyces sp. NBC_01551]MCX4544707.1 MFS transporter [Streptomyces sp. NBC_01565]